MRIWFAASISSTAYGGVHRSMMQLASELSKYGHTAVIIFAHPKYHRHRYRFSLSLAMRLILHFWERPHWIVARSSDGLASALLSGFLHMKTRVALHSHGWEERVTELEKRLPSTLINNPTTWRGRFIGFSLLRWTLRKSSLCICGTVDEARWIRRRHPESKPKIAVIPNGVPYVHTPFWPSQPEKPPSFLMVGGFTWKKNLEYGVELFRRFLDVEPSARLFIVGCGSLPEQKKRLLIPLGDSVFPVESEIPEKMARWYESCPFLLFPSRYEGGRPFSILEAQSRGCIVFASDIPANRECITMGTTGFILSGANPVADAALIRSVYRNNARMQKVGRAAWKKAMRNQAQRQGQRCARILLTKLTERKRRGKAS